MAHQYFAGAIWTHHALERLSDRKLSQEKAGLAFTTPDKIIHGKEAGSTEFQKQFGSHLITIIAKQNDKKEWIIVSCWVDPPFPGTKDYQKKELYKEYRRAGFWRKVWLALRQQLYG